MLNRLYYLPAFAALLCCPAFGQGKSDTTKSTNRFAVPQKASPEELVRFLDYLKVTQPTRDEAKDRIRAVYECSAKILGTATTDDHLVKAAEARLSVLSVMPRIDPDYIGQTQDQFLKKLAAHKNPKLAAIAKHFEILSQAKNLMKLKPVERTALVEEGFELAKKYGMDARLFTLLRTNMAMEFENSGNYKQAGDIYKRLAAMMATANDPRLKEYGPKLTAAATRCLDLLGKPIELTGSQRDGKGFDWAAYRGKVVLVDFWATWCGPCVKELPRLKKLYEEYHDAGFEIVGINMDSNQTRLTRFLDDQEIPWAQIVGDAKNFGWKHPVVVKYGINSVPTQMLVDRDGNVVSLNLRGRELESQLRVLFPETGSSPGAK